MTDEFIQKHIQITKPQLAYCKNEANTLHMPLSTFIRLVIDYYISSIEREKKGGLSG